MRSKNPAARTFDTEAPPEDGTVVVDTALRPSEVGQEAFLERPGQYVETRQELGRGALGVVDLVQDQLLDREVARKSLHVPHGEERFLREARITARLQHPNIVPIYEIGERPDGSLYYTMRRIRGRTLGEALAGCATLQERLGWLGAFSAVCDAVAYAHSQGVVHRDLKPANVMVGEFGETVVVDWGLASVRGQSEPAAGGSAAQAFDSTDVAGVTAVGAIMGTPAYMSPEQAWGENAKVGPASDIYALGVMLFQLVAGRLPFDERDPVAMIALARTQPVPLLRTAVPGIAPELEAIVSRATARRPEDRYPSAEALARDVNAFRSGGLVAAYPYGPVDRVARWAQQHRGVVMAAALAATLVATSGTVAAFRVAAERDLAMEAGRVARAAEQDAEARRLESEGHLADALLARAQNALKDHDRAAAWQYATGALARREDPVGRGIVARISGDWTPELVRRMPDGCGRAGFLADDSVVCEAGDAIVAWSPAGAELWRAPRGEAGRLVPPQGGRWALLQDGFLSVREGPVEVARAELPAGVDELSSAAWTLDGRTVVIAARHDRENVGLLRWTEGAGTTLLPWEARSWNLYFEGERLHAVALSGGIWSANDAFTELTLVHEAPYGLSGMARAPDGRVVAAASNGHVFQWERGERQPAVDVDGEGGTGQIAWAAGSELVVDVRENGRGLVRDGHSLAILARLPVEDADVRSLATSPSGRFGITSGDRFEVWSVDDYAPDSAFHGNIEAGVVQFWFPRQSDALAAWTTHGAELWSFPDGRARHAWSAAPIRDGDVSADGGTWFLAEPGVLVARGVDGVERWRVPDDGRGFEAIDVSPDGATVLARHGDATEAYATADGVLRWSAPGVWPEIMMDFATERGAVVFAGEAWAEVGPEGVGPVHALAGDPFFGATSGDGRRVAFALESGEIVVHDPTTGEIVARVPAFGTSLFRVALDARGERVAVASRDHRIRVFRVADAALLGILDGHANRVQALAFSPDGRWLVSSSWDRLSRRWDLDALTLPVRELADRGSLRFGTTLDGASIVKDASAAAP